MNDFAQLVPEARAFFSDLAANNSRDWFTENKPRYEAAVKAPAEALLDVIGSSVETATGVKQTPKLYRIHRDLRFSKDKTPYNTHMHLQWSDKATGICHLFGLSREYATAGVGAMMFDKPALAAWRARIAADGADFAALIDGLQADGFRLDEPGLKRVPSPFPQDHPRGELLKRKGIVLWKDLSEDEMSAPVRAMERVFAQLGDFRAGLEDVLSP